MAKSARASVVKKNKSNLKKKVFGPVETARNDRLSSKLLELASQPKPPRAEMDVDQNEPKDTAESEVKENEATKDVDMDADDNATAKPTSRSNRSFERQKAARSGRVEKKKVPKKSRNTLVFPKHPKKPGKRNKR